jgi:hypothetical protein
MVSTRTTAKPYDRPEVSPPHLPPDQKDADELDSDAPDSKPEVSGDEYVEGSKKTQANPKAVKAKAVPKKKTPNTKVKTEGASGGTASGKWTPEEDWALFLQIHPRASRADWNAIAAVVGRDAKVSLVVASGLAFLVLLLVLPRCAMLLCLHSSRFVGDMLRHTSTAVPQTSFMSTRSSPTEMLVQSGIARAAKAILQCRDDRRRVPAGDKHKNKLNRVRDLRTATPNECRSPQVCAVRRVGQDMDDHKMP